MTSQFFACAIKEAYPDMEYYQYFRSDSTGLDTCLDLPALGVIFGFRKKYWNEEWSIVAQQCGVVLSDILQEKTAYSIQMAEAAAERGKMKRMNMMLPNLDERRRQAAVESNAHLEGAAQARQASGATSSSRPPKASAHPYSAASSQAPPTAKAPTTASELHKIKKQKK